MLSGGHESPIAAVQQGVTRLKRPPSLPEQIADEIVRLAASGRYALGERLPEIELAAEFEVSRIPIREALRLLESRGITVSTPNRGMRLMSVGQPELRQMLTVRASLERLAVRQTLEGGKNLPLKRLRGFLTAIRQGARRNDAQVVAAADLEFHRSLCLASENSVLLGFWDALSTKMMIIFGAATRTKNLHRLIETHTTLFATIETGSVAEIEEAIERHILFESELDGVVQRSLPSRSTG